MAAPAFRAAGTAVNTANSVANPTNLSPVKNAATQNGDLMLCVAESIRQSATVSTPTGWVLLTGFPVASGTSGGGRIYVFARIADGGANDAPTVTWSGLTTGTSGDSSSAQIISFSSALYDQSGAIPAATDTAATTSFTLPGITTNVNNAMAVGIAMRVDDNAHTFTVTTFTERADRHTATGVGHGTEVSSLLQSTAGATGNGTVTPSLSTSQRVLAVSVAVAPSDVTTIADQSGNSHTGLIAGGVTTGQTKPTDARSDYIAQIQALSGDTLIFDECWDQVPSSAKQYTRVRTTYSPFTNSAIRSFGLWVNRDAVNAATDILMTSGGDAGGGNLGLIATWGLTGTGGNDVIFTPGIIGSAGVTWSAAFPGSGQWVHLGLVYNQSTADASLYVNGSLISTQTVPGTTTWGGTSPNYLTWGGVQTQNSTVDGKLYGAFVVEGNVTAAQWLTLASDDFERSAAIDAAGAIATSATFFTVFERATSLDATASIASAPQRDRLRSAALDATAAIASAPQRDLLRQAVLSATGAVESSGVAFSIFERSAALDAAGGVSAAPQRDLLRQTAIGATAAISSSGESETGTQTFERSASVSATATVVSQATFYSILERSAGVDAIATIAAFVSDRTLYGFADGDGEYGDYLSVAAGTHANAARILVGHDEVDDAGVADLVADVEAAGLIPVICVWTVDTLVAYGGASYYGGRCAAAASNFPNALIECMNEPDLFGFTPNLAAQFTKAAVDACPAGRVIGAATSAQPTGEQFQDEMYLLLVLNGGMTGLAGVSTHMYPTDANDWQDEVEARIARTAIWGKPVYVTEIGFQWGFFHAPAPLQEDVSAEFFDLYYPDARIGGIFYYRLVPSAVGSPEEFQRYSVATNAELRAALTVAFASVGLERGVSIAATASIAASAQRELMRQVALEAVAQIDAFGLKVIDVWDPDSDDEWTVDGDGEWEQDTQVAWAGATSAGWDQSNGEEW